MRRGICVWINFLVFSEIFLNAIAPKELIGEVKKRLNEYLKIV